MYTNTLKNELTTDQKRKLLLNTCGILLSQWRKEYSFKTYANFTGFIIMVFILFDFILYIPVNNFSVMSGRVFLGWTMINMFCSRTQHSDAGEARNLSALVTR